MTRRDPNYIDAHVGARIRMRRQLVNMSQERLGELLGITFQQVQKYEKGSNRISASRLFYASKTLGVPVQFFYDGLPGNEGPDGLREGGSGDEFSAALMTPEGVQLAKAFKDADTSTKRKLIAALARLIVESEG
ncbi:MAG TPA: helix-turn-helix transcriptional regulator [Aestuariivirga sp.]|jgi:transcriptional regulator with XRE-family HTH domain|nr:helix-turn-helix domain-containing protein [Pseudomonadota bacterium]